MDVTGLKVSIEVDMSGFLDAMEAILAIVEVVIDQLRELENSVKTAFSGITSTGEESKSAWAKFWEGFKDVVDVVKTLKDFWDILKGLSGAVGALGESGVFAEIAAVAPEVAAAAAAIALITVGVMGLIKLYKEWHEQVQQVNSATQNQPSVGNSSDSTEGSKPISDGKLHLVMKNGILVSANNQPTNAAHDTNNVVNNDTDNGTKPCPCETNTGTASVTTPQLTSDHDLKAALQHKMELIKEGVGNVKPEIKIRVEAKGVPQHQAQITNLTNQYVVLDQKVQQTTNDITKQTAVSKQSTDEAANNIKVLKSLGMEVGTGVLEDIGKAAAGAKNPFGNLFKLIGDAIKSLGQQLLAVGAGMEAGAAALPILGLKGASALAAGAALVIAGSAMGAVKMASGGLVSGSSIVNVGEYTGASHNPEVIAPLDKLHSMLGGQTQNHTFEIQGDKLVSILQRVDNNTSFALGGA